MPHEAWPTIDDLLKFYFSAGIVSSLDYLSLTAAQQAIAIQAELDGAVKWFENKTRWRPFLCKPTRVQWLYLYGNPTGGSYTVRYGDGETAPILDFTAASLQAAIEQIAGVGKVTVTGVDTGPFTITLAASLSPYEFITAGTNLLTGGTSPTILAGEVPVAHDIKGRDFLALLTGYTSIGAVFGAAYGSNLGTYLEGGNHYSVRYFRDDTEGPIDRLQAVNWGWGNGWFFSGGSQSVNVVGRRGYSLTVPDDAWLAVLRRAATSALSSVTAAVTRGTVEWKEGDVSEKYGSGGAYTQEASAWERQSDSTANAYMRLRSG